MVVPITAEYTSFTATFFSFTDKPLDKVLTIHVVLTTVVLVSEVDVSEDCGLAE
jgi:hypothetical protein